MEPKYEAPIVIVMDSLPQLANRIRDKFAPEVVSGFEESSGHIQFQIQGSKVVAHAWPRASGGFDLMFDPK